MLKQYVKISKNMFQLITIILRRADKKRKNIFQVDDLFMMYLWKESRPKKSVSLTY